MANTSVIKLFAASWVKTLLAGAAILSATACTNVYYNAMERLGYEKRDILVTRVERSRDAQSDAQETFRNALERYQSVIDTPDTDLRARYEEVLAAYDDSEDAAANVRRRINDVEDVAGDLFDEWEDELDRYTNQDLRASSERQLGQTREQYQRLISQMRQTEERMEPVLRAFEDQMLYLRHNLNAQAIGALEGELARIRSDVNTLIDNMEASIRESEAFIQRLRNNS
ncbi:DUF2959 domain-containing protein [Aliidiomarina maris]|uniref:DUF2959 domain-containing protein n=1 Tax=Aliidiomarina maris TaxID=531312 RepID=A0A327WX32_9GAMM|nr:DUF2959 domain-containing protein [Aliidiomarina maris]RAJ97050.1 Protein of unknown function (DUF2959) [Aliidiomarina maris]RUO24655.1 DUF2959 domain-containing protein [Aliidiomarina maris]